MIKNTTRATDNLTGELADQTILIIEDSRTVAMTVANMLHEHWGCRVVITTTQAQVQALLAKGAEQYSLAISDLNLPDSPNGEVIDLLVAADIPTIAMTGTFERDKVDKFMRKGVIDYVLKKSINSLEYVANLVERLHKNISLKILVVDDSESMCQVTSLMLAKQRLQVLTAKSGQQALQCLAEHNDIALMLVDYNMESMDGLHLLAEVRKTHNKESLCVIGMSGGVDKSMSAQFLRLGANDFIIKPFTYEELVGRVNHNLEMMDSLKALRFETDYDGLTGLYNRRTFFHDGERLCQDAVKDGSPWLAVVLDIDHFKKINDRYGYVGGDAALQHLASLLRRSLGAYFMARLGGDKFAVLMADDGQQHQALENFRQQVETTPALIEGQSVAMTVSMGVSSHRHTSLDSMLRPAGDCLDQAKEEGRNRIVWRTD